MEEQQSAMVEAIKELAPTREEQARIIGITRRQLDEWIKGRRPRILRNTPPSVLRGAATDIEQQVEPEPAQPAEKAA